MSWKKGRLLANAGIILFLLGRQLAGASEFAEQNASEKSSSPPLFESGRYEASLNSGVLFSPFVATHGRPTLNYTISELQLGYMLSDVTRTDWLRGNLELAGAALGSSIFDGPGSYIAGATVWMRYNFVPPRSALIPYIQAGGGFVFTDTARGIVGERFNFNLGLALGARYVLASHWSVNLEYR